MTAGEELEKAMSRCKSSRSRALYYTRNARREESVVLGDHQTTRKRTREANTTRLDDAGDKKPEARSRTEDCLRAGEDT